MERYHQVPVYKRFTYQSLFILSHSYVAIFLPFCAAGDFLCGFSVAETAPVGAYIFFFYSFLIFYNFSSLTIYFQKGGLYIRPVFPTSIALKLLVLRKRCIFPQRSREKGKLALILIINSASRKTLGVLCEA